MKNPYKICLLIACALSLSNCAMPRPSAGAGWIYTDVKEGEYVDNKVEISRNGEACATNVLGIASTGDATIDTAKRVSNIKNVATIDRSYFSVLGIFAKGCTVVQGN